MCARYACVQESFDTRGSIPNRQSEIQDSVPTAVEDSAEYTSFQENRESRDTRSAVPNRLSINYRGGVKFPQSNFSCRTPPPEQECNCSGQKPGYKVSVQRLSEIAHCKRQVQRLSD